MRRRHIALCSSVLLLLVLALLTLGCDDQLQSGEGGKNSLVLGVSTPWSCPTNENSSVANVDVQATVITTDGSYVPKETILFSTTEGQLEPESAKTPDNTGNPSLNDIFARSVLSHGRVPGAKIQVRAVRESTGEELMREIDAAGVPTPFYVGAIRTADQFVFNNEIELPPSDEETEFNFFVFVQAAQNCDIHDIHFEISYNPSIVDIAMRDIEEPEPGDPTEEMAIDYFVLGSTETSTRVAEVTGGGSSATLSIDFSRIDDGSPTGITSFGGVTYVQIAFRTVAVGEANVQLDSLVFNAADETSFPINTSAMDPVEVTVAVPDES